MSDPSGSLLIRPSGVVFGALPERILLPTEDTRQTNYQHDKRQQRTHPSYK